MLRQLDPDQQQSLFRFLGASAEAEAVVDEARRRDARRSGRHLVGGELALIGLYRQLAEAGELIGREDGGFRAKLLELEARAARGDVGRT